MGLEKQLRKTDDTPIPLSIETYVRKMKGTGRKDSRIQLRDSLVAALGGLIAMVVISFFAVTLGHSIVLGPIGASCLLIFGAHNGPFSQPRQVIGGHFLATLSSLTIWDLFGKSHVTIGVVLATVIILMILTRTVHPPAAASAVVAINSQAGWGYLLTIVICVMILVLISVLYNNLFEKRQYPNYWF